eukprot:13082724-Ditylum_brightwellii.AAC.1
MEELHPVCSDGGRDLGEGGKNDVQAAGETACTEVGVPGIVHATICQPNCPSGNFALCGQMHKRRAGIPVQDRPYISSI